MLEQILKTFILGIVLSILTFLPLLTVGLINYFDRKNNV